MRSLCALALLGSCVGLSAQAQHVGAGRVGSPGGGAGVHAGGGVHGSLGAPGMAHPGSGVHPGNRSRGTGNFGSVRPGYGSYGLRSVPRSSGYGFLSSRPIYNHINRGPRDPRVYGGYPPYGHGYGYGGGYPGPGFGYTSVLGVGYPITPFWDFGDSLGYDASPYAGFAETPYDSSGYGQAPEASQPYAEQAPDGYGATAAPPPDSQPYAGGQRRGDQPMVYAPYPYNYPSAPPTVTVVTLPPPLREEDAVTLFFRDGRPPEQIRNYALTRTSLLVTGDRMREIPLTELDLPLTVRVNRAAGVDFQLPAAQ